MKASGAMIPEAFFMKILFANFLHSTAGQPMAFFTSEYFTLDFPVPFFDLLCPG